MAAPINVFKSFVKDLASNAFSFSGSNTLVYTAPGNNTAIVLMAQIANTGTETINASFRLYKDGSTSADLVSGFSIPVNDSADVLSGKLIVEEGQELHARIDSTAGGRAGNIVISVLESRNA